MAEQWQWSLDVNPDPELQLSHTSPNQEQLSHTSPNQELYAKSIYRVPKILTDINRQAYEPKLVSFGPYHHGHPNLRYMEQDKVRALNQFLRRIEKASKTIKDVENAMRAVEDKLFASYDSLHIKDFDQDCCDRDRFRRHDWREKKDEFLKLMIIDGCFALEVMLAEVNENDSQYMSIDLMFGAKKKNYFIPFLVNDMLLLENQLPLLALTTLAAIEGSAVGDVSTLIKKFYYHDSTDDKKAQWFSKLAVNVKKKDSEVPTEQSSHSEAPAKQSSHILDLYREIRTAKGKYHLTNAEMHSATELSNAGVLFRNNESNSFRDITFKGNVLSIPRLEINDFIMSVLLNLIAFEQLNQSTNNNVTAYAVFISNLINTVKDVALLKTKNIIKGIRVSDEDIADMFKKITKGVTHVNIQVGKKDDNVNEDLDNYYKKRINHWKASFRDILLENGLAVLISIYALGFTIIQTAYTIMQYYRD